MSARRKQFDEDEFNAFLQESMSSESSMDTARINKYVQPKKKNAKKKKSEPLPWWAEQDDQDDDTIDYGLTGTGQSFMKKKKKEEETAVPLDTKGTTDLQMSRDSLDTGKIEGTKSFGKDTMEEMADRERFYQDLRRQANGTVDYHQLNRALDNSETMATEFGRRIDEEEEEEEEEEEQESSVREKPKSQESSKTSHQEKGGMLDKVALLDSMESTLGTKPAASRETLPDEDMGPILEHTSEHGTGEQRGNEGADNTEDNRASDTTRGVKSAALGYTVTDTSREMEAYHDALRKVGMGTLDMDKDLTLKDSSTIMGGTQKTAETTGDGTQPFGLKQVAPSAQGNFDEVDNETGSRSRNLEKTENKPSVHFQDDKDIQEYTLDSHGFDLSPAHSRPSSLDITPRQQDGGDDYDLSPLDKYADPQDFPLKLTEDTDRSKYPEVIHSTPPVPARRSKKTEKKRKEKFSSVKSSGYGQKLVEGRSPSPRRADSSSTRVGFGSSTRIEGTPEKQGTRPSSSKTKWSPANTSRNQIQGTEVISKDGEQLQLSSSLANSHLIASVESFTNYLQNHFATNADSPSVKTSTPQRSGTESKTPASAAVDGAIKESALAQDVLEWQNQWKEERRRLAKSQAELAAQRHEHERKVEELKIEHEQTVFKLKQENFVLSSKVLEDDDKGSQRSPRTKKTALGSETAEEERVALLEKEIREQEKLLRGYQQENERVYGDMKKQQTAAKQRETKMFQENQKLTTQLNNIKEELSHRDRAFMPASSTAASLGAGKIAHLEAELKHARARERSLVSDVEILQKAKLELEEHIDKLVQQEHILREKIEQESGLQSVHYKELQKKHNQETERLQRKLKWYAENQELLDRDAAALKEKDAELKQLHLQLQQLQTDAGRKRLEAKARVKERASDAKRIQDLERQVREMETIVRKRHPNSLPVLMWAASAAPESEAPKIPSIQFLEQRIKKLEAEAEHKDDEAKRSIRLLEQKYNAMKAKYEDHITDLEKQFDSPGYPGGAGREGAGREGEHPHSHATALQRELDSVKDRKKKREAELELELNTVRTELANLKSKQAASEKKEKSKQDESKTDLQQRVKALQKQVSLQEAEKQQQLQAISSLRREKMQLQSKAAKAKTTASASQLEKKSRTTKSVVDSRREKAAPDAPNKPSKLPVCAPKSGDKEYEPDKFAKEHVSDTLRENQELKTRMDQQQWDYEQQRVHLQKLLAEAEARERRVYEDAEYRIKGLKSSHEAEVQQVIANHALQHSTSRQAALQTQVEAQEVMLDKMKQQLRELEPLKDQLAAKFVREATLETQVQQLLLELKEAKRSHTPEMRHLEALQEKIHQLENSHQHWEHGLRSLSHLPTNPAHLTQRFQHLQTMLDSKNRQTEVFRAELDSILEVLRELQRQGVTIPVQEPILSSRS